MSVMSRDTDWYLNPQLIIPSSGNTDIQVCMLELFSKTGVVFSTAGKDPTPK